jgi:hypothetical protein
MRILKIYLILVAVVTMCALGAVQSAYAQPGTLLSTVTLPGNGSSVSGTLAVTGFGTHYITTRSFTGGPIDIYIPCLGVACAATLVATKTLPFPLLDPVSGLAFDPTRTTATNVFVWGVDSNNIYLIDLGDPTVSGPVNSQVLLCTAGNGGAGLTDGVAYDASDDTLYYSPDVNLSVFQISLGPIPPACTTLNIISPEDMFGFPDGSVSGVAIGAPGTLYIARNGLAEIRQVFNPSGVFISQFATTSGRVEALTCDPNTYAPFEAILAKDAFNGLYEAFEVEPGTCPEIVASCDPDPRTQGFWRRVCKKAHPEQPDRSILTDELCGDLNPNPHNDPCERARSQQAAVLLNLDSDRLQGVCIVTANGDSLTDTVAEIEALIAANTNDSCKEASNLAASINEGGVS